MMKNSLLLACLVLSSVQLQAGEVTLAVGPGGQRMFSMDGVHWEGHAAWGEPKHDQNDLNVAKFFKGAAYVGGGYFSGRMTATRDGINWSDGVLPGSSPIFGLEVHGDALYAITLRGQVFRSMDGENYELMATADMPTKTHWIRGTASGNGVIVGSGDFGPVITYRPGEREIIVNQMVGQTEKKATLQRVAFGNGVFVVGGQDGLLASSHDGLIWVHNEVHPERGDISSVVWAEDRFLASPMKGPGLESRDGSTWTPVTQRLPRKMVNLGGRLYGWSWPPHKILGSADGRVWEPVPNEKEFHLKHVARGSLAGEGDPPRIPVPRSRRPASSK